MSKTKHDMLERELDPLEILDDDSDSGYFREGELVSTQKDPMQQRVNNTYSFIRAKGFDEVVVSKGYSGKELELTLKLPLYRVQI
jgi:hypothetical protein